MGATDINKKLTSAMLLIIWMCVVTVLNGSKYVKKKKEQKKLIYSFEIPEQNWEKYSFNEKKNQNFCIKK